MKKLIKKLTGKNITKEEINNYLENEYLDLNGLNLISTNLNDADLANANLKCADLTNADLFCADLTNADLTDADLNNADLKGADLTNIKLTKKQAQEIADRLNNGEFDND